VVDFTTSQLSWIVVGACGIGGTGYLSMNTNINDLNTKTTVIQVKAENAETKMNDMGKQLDRIEQALVVLQQTQNRKGSK